MNWKDTVIKSKNIKWKHPRIKNTDDGKVDFILTIPLTTILEAQAKISFLTGIKEYHNYLLELLTSGQSIKDIKTKLEDKLTELGFSPSGVQQGEQETK